MFVSYSFLLVNIGGRLDNQNQKGNHKRSFPRARVYQRDRCVNMKSKTSHSSVTSKVKIGTSMFVNYNFLAVKKRGRIDNQNQKGNHKRSIPWTQVYPRDVYENIKLRLPIFPAP